MRNTRRHSASGPCGQTKEENTTARQGYFYFLDGGTVDCSGVAKGVAVECGRNIQVRNMNIVDTPLGFAINNGTNGGSSDADIFNPAPLFHPERL